LTLNEPAIKAKVRSLYALRDVAHSELFPGKLLSHAAELIATYLLRLSFVSKRAHNARIKNGTNDMASDSSGETLAGWIKYIATTALAVAAVIVGVIQYRETSRATVRTPFLQKQSELCFSAAGHAARLASTVDVKTWQASREEFWMLYWGQLAVVEDVGTFDSGTANTVAAAMVSFGNELKQMNVSNPTLPATTLSTRSLDIAYRCRDLLVQKWSENMSTGWWASYHPLR
jgi:hypothetical protein